MSSQQVRALSGVSAGAVLVVGLALGGSLNSWRVAADYRRQTTDPYGAAVAMERFQPILSELPASGRIGYITDLSDKVGATAFLAATYALAPRIGVPVAEDSTPEWAVGNFSRPGDFAAAGARFGYTVVRDAGNGVILYRKAAR